MQMGDSPPIETFPEDCIAHAISLTSPCDACRSSAVSTLFRSAAASDIVWDRFLPADLQSVLSRAVPPLPFSSSSSKRDLFFHLCHHPILIDGGKMSFSLDRSTGAKCYMLSARELSVVWGDSDRYWKWDSQPDSRFPEVANLLDVCWLEIHGKIETKMLSEKTKYAAYLIFKLSDESYGLGYPPQEASIKVGAHTSSSTVCLQPSDLHAHMHARRHSSRVWFRRYMRWRGVMALLETEEQEDPKDIGGQAPQARDDGWMELELGEFFNHQGEDGEVTMSLLEVKGGQWKNGLIIEGIEVRPKK